MKLLIAGHPDYNDELNVHKTLDWLNAQVGIDLLLEGQANQTDYHARIWAKKRGVQVHTIAQEDRPRGSHMRNTRLISNLDRERDSVLQFGAADELVRLARRGMLNVIVEAV